MNTLRSALHRYWNSALNPIGAGGWFLRCDRSDTHPTTVRAVEARAGLLTNVDR
jgi:hypothetical protein